jgi:membrane fusion protein, multidrug efflux system
MGRLSFWVIVGILGLALAGGAYHYLADGAGPPGVGPAARAETRPAERTIAVEAERVAVDTVLDDIRAVGTLRPNEAVIVSPEIAGRIARLGFAEGKKVSAGDVLVELDATILRAELAKAQSDLTLAAANNERATTLARQGTGTLRGWDEAAATFRAAQANVDLAKARLDKTSITAPLSGIVGLRAISVGAYVTPGDRIVELSDVDPIKVDFRVPELSLSRVHAGQAVKVTVDALPGRTYDGHIYAIDPVVDPGGRAVRLRARIPNPDGDLSPGLFARVQIVLERRDNSVLVPESAVFAQGQKRFVYRVVDGRAVQTEVTLGQRRPGQVEVRGLDGDAVIVTAGHQQLRDAIAVEIVSPGIGS